MRIVLTVVGNTQSPKTCSAPKHCFLVQCIFILAPHGKVYIFGKYIYVNTLTC